MDDVQQEMFFVYFFLIRQEKPLKIISRFVCWRYCLGSRENFQWNIPVVKIASLSFLVLQTKQNCQFICSFSLTS